MKTQITDITDACCFLSATNDRSTVLLMRKRTRIVQAYLHNLNEWYVNERKESGQKFIIIW